MENSEVIDKPRKSTLHKLTQAQIASQRELETRKSIIKDEDDPWWEKRGTRTWQKQLAKTLIIRSKSVGRSGMVSESEAEAEGFALRSSNSKIKVHHI